MPPHDVAAEQSVLGGMLLSKDAISDVIEAIRPADHYRPAHQLIHEAILDLYARGEPADPITVVNELNRRGELNRIGGAPYLHTLIASVPTAANAGYYARIVRERAILRRLVEAGTRIVQLGYTGDGDADEMVDRAQAEVYGVTDRRIAEDYASLSEIMPGALEEIEAIGAHGGGISGVPTGFSDLDALTNGLHPGQMVVVAARPAVGKALALDTPLPTPAGWTTMGEVAVGDHLIGADGKPTKVVAATEVMNGRPCYEVEFSDGEVIVADAEHQWVTWSPSSVEPPQVVTTEAILADLRVVGADRLRQHAVAPVRPLDLPEAELPVPPREMGMMLAGRRVLAGVGGADVPGGDGRIPVAYLRGSLAQRKALLDGMVVGSSDATVSGTRQISVHDEGLAADVQELVHSLGYVCKQTVAPLDSVHASRWRYIVDVRPVLSRPVRCVQVDSGEHMYLAGRSMVPTHNSALALDFARSATIKHGLPTVVFSLEMGRNEITMRLLSAEARVPMNVMRTGQMTDDDWTRLARRMSEVADAPLFIDDSPNMSLMEIRAKCRRLKQRHDLKLVIIDYLQLMSSPGKVESRQQEVSAMSRSLKLLAKELEVPVVALSQLNRGPEQRQDKKPMLSDLRESGCLTADTTILRADTGAPVTFADLMRDGWDGVLVWSLDEQRRLVPSPVVNVFESGTKEAYRLRLASGREVKATANHPFLTLSGWTPLGDLEEGDRVGIARRVPDPVSAGLGWSEHRLGLLAHLIGDGCVIKKQPVHYTSNDPANLDFVEEAAAAEFGITPRRVTQQTWWHSYLPAPAHCTHGRGNPIHDWFRELGIEYRGARGKRIPAVLFSASEDEICIFLRHLWATDGCVRLPKGKAAPKVYCASSSRELADGVALLLTRLGIVARIRQVEKAGYEPGYHVIVADGPSLRAFCSRVGVHGRRGETARDLGVLLADRGTNTNADTVPREVWDIVKAERVRAGLTERQFQAAIGTDHCGTTLYESCPSRDRLMRCADALDSETLREIASSDVFWDKIVGIEPLGPQPVYDATVKEAHNFLANGTNVHNSIEQDADVVILLHREDAYEKESPRAGEADLIVAKHRNGPTATVVVAFQGHYSRFVDMAPA
ncbi:MAG TPA: replicative DNA helicase [Trebonia sp.]|jgi:replicative DNA helicase